MYEVDALKAAVMDGYKQTRFAIGNLPDDVKTPITAGLAAAIDPMQRE